MRRDPTEDLKMQLILMHCNSRMHCINKYQLEEKKGYQDPHRNSHSRAIMHSAERLMSGNKLLEWVTTALMPLTLTSRTNKSEPQLALNDM